MHYQYPSIRPFFKNHQALCKFNQASFDTSVELIEKLSLYQSHPPKVLHSESI